MLVPAESHPLTAEQVEQQMRKSGGTPFVIEAVNVQYHGNLFAPLADLNRARREFLTLAESALIAASRPSAELVEQAKVRGQAKAGNYPATGTAISPVKPRVPLGLAMYVDTPDAVRAAAESGCDRVYFEPDIPVSGTVSCSCHSLNADAEEQIKTAIEPCRAHDIPLVWKFPRITRTAFSDTVLPLVPRISEIGIAGIMVENPGMIDALRRIAPQCKLYGATGLNVFNHATAEKLSSCCHLLTLSPELSRDEIRFLVSAARTQGPESRFALIVQGISEAIISDDCLLEPFLHCRSDAGEPHRTPGIFYGIRDSTGHVFPVRMDRECRTHIGNAAELCLVDHLPEIRDIGISEVVIDARGRPAGYVLEMTRMYREALDIISAQKPEAGKQLQALKDRIKRISYGEITAGHFIRGLKEA
jgi:putative protease